MTQWKPVCRLLRPFAEMRAEGLNRVLGVEPKLEVPNNYLQRLHTSLYGERRLITVLFAS